MHNMGLTEARDEIAIIGMAGRFPGARDIDEFWDNLRSGVESIAFFATEESAASGVDLDLLNDPAYVPAVGFLEEADSFDASFFGYSPREAQLMDPQHRVMLECAWMAMEHAGYDPEEYYGLIGVFGGVARNTYFIHNVAVYLDLIHSGALYEAMLGSEKDFPATRISYKLNLKGPSINVQTACSTSGVAVHLACQSLLTGECDMALAGGARVQVPLMAGYVYAEGGIPSPDGHCRAFDEKAQGTVYGSGVGFIVLKRLADAIGDGDCIHAIIKGSAINNDGASRVGYTAPSIQGQAAVIEDALAMADVDADAISYIEAHGTGTPIGDPIEIAALTKAFRKTTDQVSFCPIGSVKTNIGHLDAGAAVAGIIKTVLALRHELIPPSLHFERPNPQIDFASSPFYVNSKLTEWRAGDAPRRAGVSSFGLGGSNFHIILEEAPKLEPSGASRSHQLLLLSARSDAALAQATKNLTEHLRQHPEINLADVAYTLQNGRRAFDHRRMVVCQDVDDAISALEPINPKRVVTSAQEPADRDIVFMFSGQGSQYPNMGLELYENEPTFRQQVARCSEILTSHLVLDLREVLYPEEQKLEEAAERLQQTSFTQPALFVIEYALAKLLLAWGIHPRAMVGHSLGEYVAACLAGVFSLDEALALVAARARLMQALRSGSMLAVPLTEGQIQPYLDGRVCLAVVNSPSLCVVSGEHGAIRDVEKQLSKTGVESRYLHTSHAFHSRMMDPMLEQFTEEVEKTKLRAPQIPFVSNVTGTWITPDEATDPSYWARHLRQTVRFSDCLHTLLSEPLLVLEVGPGRTLATLARQHPDKPKELVVLSTVRHPKETISDQAFILNTLGRLWLAGVQVDWSNFYADERRHRVSLPTYPFERKRYWIEPGKQTRTAAPLEPDLVPEPEPDPSSSTHTDGRDIVAYDGAPRNKVEQSLANIWQALLGVENLSIHDNFFELGGSSLLATRLFTQIAAVFGQRLPLARIFEAPTIEQLASTLDQRVSSATHSFLVRIQDGGSRPPFYCLPGNLGNVFTDLGYLSRHLGRDQPVYGLQDGVGHPAKVEALAAHHIDDIRDVQSEGPYYLGGVCLGGVVAFEMAQQLVRQGQDVALLALVEPASLPLPGASSYFDLIAEIGKRLIRHVGDQSRNVAALGWAERIMYVRLKMKLAGNFWALKRYLPQVYPGHFHLFLTKESIAGTPRLGWVDLATGGVEVHEIPGTHRSITGDYARIEEAHMKVLGEKLRVCIDDAMIKRHDPPPKKWIEE